MHSTQSYFVRSLNEGDESAWREMNQVYRPMIVRWLRRYRLQIGDAEDIAQEVMMNVASLAGDFRHNGRVGAFRNWLRAITVNTAHNYWKRYRRQPVASGGSVFREMLGQLQDPNSETTRRFNAHYDHTVLLEMVNTIESQFHSQTIKAFRMHVMEGVAASETAMRLGVPVHVVYLAKSRVLRRLREEAAEWISEMSF